MIDFNINAYVLKKDYIKKKCEIYYRCEKFKSKDTK